MAAMLSPTCLQPHVVVQPLPALLGQPLVQSVATAGRCASPTVREAGLVRQASPLARQASPLSRQVSSLTRKASASCDSAAVRCASPSREEIEREKQRLSAEAVRGVEVASRPSSPVARLSNASGAEAMRGVEVAARPSSPVLPSPRTSTGGAVQVARLSSPSRGSNSAVPRGLAENLKGRGASPEREAPALPMLDVRDPDLLSPPLALVVHDPDEDVQFDLCVCDTDNAPAELSKVRQHVKEEEDQVGGIKNFTVCRPAPVDTTTASFMGSCLEESLTGSMTSMVLRDGRLQAPTELEESLDQSAMSMVIRSNCTQAPTEASFVGSTLEESFGAQSVMSMVIRDGRLQAIPTTPRTPASPFRLAPAAEEAGEESHPANTLEAGPVPTRAVPVGSAAIVAQEITIALVAARSNAAKRSSASPSTGQLRSGPHSQNVSSTRSLRREEVSPVCVAEDSRTELEQKLVRAVAQLEAKLASCAHVQKAYESAYSAASLRRERCEESVNEAERTLAGLEEQEKRCRAQGSTLFAGSSLRQNWEAKLKGIEDKREVVEQNLLSAMSELKREEQKEQTARDDIRKSIQESRATFQALDELRGSPDQFQQVRRSMKEPISAVRAASPKQVSRKSFGIALPDHVRKSIRESRATFQALDELSSSTPTPPSTGRSYADRTGSSTARSPGRSHRGSRNSDIGLQSTKNHSDQAAFRPKRTERHSDPSAIRSFGSSLGRFFRKTATDQSSPKLSAATSFLLPSPRELAVAACQKGESDECTHVSGSSKESADLQGRLASLPLEDLRLLLLALPREQLEGALPEAALDAPAGAC